MADIDLYSLITKKLDTDTYRELNWTGSFHEYLQLIQQDPNICRNSFQRMYDMIMSYGYDEYTRLREEYVHYRFFSDPIDEGKDAVFGLDRPLMRLVYFF